MSVPRRSAFLRFVVVNVVNTGIYYGLYLLLLLVLPYVLANVLALGAAILLAYAGNARWTFGTAMSGRALLAFVAGNGATTVLRTLVLWLLVEQARMSELTAPVLATAITFPVAYVLAELAMARRTVPRHLALGSGLPG